MVEKMKIVSTERGMLVRMMDKMARLSNIVDAEASVLDEKTEDTLLDLANYAIILASYIKDKNAI